MKQKFDKGEDFEFSDETSPHDVACVLKEFFRSLPEPLMTRELYYPLLKTRSKSQREKERERDCCPEKYFLQSYQSITQVYEY